MKKTLLFLFLLCLPGFICLSNNDVPVAISPGMAGGVGVVQNCTPTFSWSGVAWAQKYRVVVFGVEADGKKINDEMALTAKPVLSEDIVGGGFSWTPSVAQRLAEGADYTWYVGAMDANGTWAWSESRRFRVEASAKAAFNEVEQAGLLQKKVTAEANSEKALRNEPGLSEKETPKGTPEGPMGTEGALSTFYGSGAGVNNSSDDNMNSFFGSYAGNNNSTGMYNVYIGRSAGRMSTDAINNTFVGWVAGYTNTTGDYNTFIGNGAGFSNTSGEANTFVGMIAGYATTTGFENVFMGDTAGYNNTIGYQNIFFGFEAGYTNTTGANNVYIGRGAGRNNVTGNLNTFIGFKAGYNETGSNKLYIDNSDTANPLIYGDFSTDKVGINGWLGVGTETPAYPMELKTTGRAATFVASRSGGASNFINATDTYGQFGTVNNFAVRILVNSSSRLTLNADNSMVMASGARCTAGGVWQNASSRALKENIVDLKAKDAISTLKGLTPVRFVYKADKSDEQVGFIAEDVPELVAAKDRKSMSAMDVVAVLTKVVQEQQRFIQQQQKINEKMKNEIEELKKKR